MQVGERSKMKTGMLEMTEGETGENEMRKSDERRTGKQAGNSDMCVCRGGRGQVEVITETLSM